VIISWTKWTHAWLSMQSWPETVQSDSDHIHRRYCWYADCQKKASYRELLRIVHT